MAQALLTNLLSQSVGFPVKSHKGEPMGRIVDVTSGRDQEPLEYVILRTKNGHVNEDRIFAVPASTALFKITAGGRIVLRINKDELQHANKIIFDQRPRPTFHFEPIIFELCHYNQTESREPKYSLK